MLLSEAIQQAIDAGIDSSYREAVSDGWCNDVVTRYCPLGAAAVATGCDVHLFETKNAIEWLSKVTENVNETVGICPICHAGHKNHPDELLKLESLSAGTLTIHLRDIHGLSTPDIVERLKAIKH